MDVNQHQADDQPANDARGETLSIHVYRTIRERVFRGEWMPGTRLTLRALAAELGTSVQPVRDAIGKLTVERILVLRPNYSVQLPAVDRPAMDEIFAMRNLLEGEAARLGATTLTTDDHDALAAAIQTTRSIYRLETAIPERVAAIQAVAHLLATRCGSTTLADQILNLRTRTAPYYAAALAKDAVAEDEFVTYTIHIQNEFLQALRRRDPVAAAEIRKVDLYTFQHYIYRLLGISK